MSVTKSGMSDTEEIFASLVGRALIEVIEEDVCSRDDLLFIANELEGMGTLPLYVKKLRHLAEAFGKTHEGPRLMLEEVLR